MTRKIGKALVVGAGISGIRAALDLAETGYGVTLIDRAFHIGGILSQLDYQFPTNGCGMCKMLPLVRRDAAGQVCLRKGLFHENIEILLGTEVTAIAGAPGRYAVTLRQAPTWVDPRRCIGCGLCETVCPRQAPDDFNAGLGRRKAIYLPVPHNIPNTYVIDGAACNRCGECVTICPTGAVDLGADRRRAFRILVVDDEAIVRESLRDTLDEEGFGVDTAQSGAKALEMLGAGTYELMLTDIKMPAMDGVELLKEAKARHPELRVLMMTAYATVETAVEAMKIGALDYLIKPFDPEVLIPMVVKIFEQFQAATDIRREVGAIVLCGGTGYQDPSVGKNTYGYKTNPHVITSIELERLLSGAGPTQGRLVRPHDGLPVAKIAWLQCVGSRDLQIGADYCSSVCCMFAVKEAVLARQKASGDLETTIFYMDMRTFNKSFQRYRDQAESEGVRFVRCRIHSVSADPATGSPVIRYLDNQGADRVQTFDLVVLAVGQKPAPATDTLAQMAGIDLNAWGFVATDPFAPACTGARGITAGGSFSGLKDIGESVIGASAAALEASRTIHAAGGALALEAPGGQNYRDVSREPPRVLVALCTCGDRIADLFKAPPLAKNLEKDPRVAKVVFIQRSCTGEGWKTLMETAKETLPNRVLIGACLPYAWAAKLKELAGAIQLDPVLMDVVDLMPALRAALSPKTETAPWDCGADVATTVGMALARVARAMPQALATVPVTQRAVVVGGGISGMTAALAMADHGFAVVVVEKDPLLGGNLRWLTSTAGGQDPQQLRDQTIEQVTKHPRITVMVDTRVSAASGQVGNFQTVLETGKGTVETIEHGVVVLATGGHEAPTRSYAYGSSDKIVTQKELESALAGGRLNPTALTAVAMIQCVDSRQEPRNYCSRVCCTSALKHALRLKQVNPDLAIYIFYRDMMTYGFNEAYFTQARQAGVIFIAYDLEDKPVVTLAPSADGSETVHIGATDPLLRRRVDVQVDLLVLATGVIADLPPQLAALYGIDKDRDGFFAEAESKWRPVDSLKEGVFACGLCLAPRSIPESVASAGAAAQRALRILNQAKLAAGHIVATVRHSLCSLCERCIPHCPYGARTLSVEADKILVNPAMCQGCGACAAACLNGAAVVAGLQDQAMMEAVDAALAF